MIYSQVRALWASGDEQGLSQLGSDPLALLHPAARALIRSRAPLSFSYDHLPLYELCQLALIWAIGGHQEKADELASRIYYLVQAFPLFGSRENQYSEKEAEVSTDLFLTACGLARTFDAPRDAFFMALAARLPQLTITPQPPVYGWGLYERKDVSLLLALTGKGTPLGALKVGSVEIRAFGPTTPPLSDPTHFGIQRRFDEEPLQSWSSVFAIPEVWFQIEHQIGDKECSLQFRFLGLEAEKPLFMAFYIKADSALIGAQVYKPKSLNRYQGTAQTFEFGDAILKIDRPLKAQLIPLAGEGGFWNTDFLLAFEIQTAEAQCVFTLLQK